MSIYTLEESFIYFEYFHLYNYHMINFKAKLSHKIEDFKLIQALDKSHVMLDAKMAPIFLSKRFIFLTLQGLKINKKINLT